MTAAVALPFRVGPRTVWRVRRRLARVALSLSEAQQGKVPQLPAAEGDGYLVTSLPATALPPVLASNPRLKPFVRQRYRRCYADLGQSFDSYLAGFSSKSRSTVKRKVRRLAERCGGTLDLRCYRTRQDADDFHRLARAVSARSYQERLLDYGLPEGGGALADMRDRAARGAMRGWILFIDGRPASYLYAPAEGDTLVYAYLGYDPNFADLSPGTVLQFEAMRELMEERRFALFDFGEGEGQHKSLFATGSVDCLDLLLLKPSAGNLLAGWSLTAFDATVALVRDGVRRLKLACRLRR